MAQVARAQLLDDRAAIRVSEALFPCRAPW